MSTELDHGDRLQLATDARARLEAGLEQALGDRYRVEKGKKVDVYTDGIVISGFTLFDRPDEAGDGRAPFSESAFTARRRIGLIALRRLSSEGGGHSGLAERLIVSVEETLDSSEGWPVGLRDWFEGLGRSGRAAVLASTVTWCEAIVRLVGTSGTVHWSDPQYPNASLVPGRAIRLSANIDAVLGTPRSGEKLLVISDGDPSGRDRIRMGFTALVRALGIGCAPERVTAGAPSRGSSVRYPVASELLDLAVDQVVQAVALADRSRSQHTSSPTQELQ